MRRILPAGHAMHLMAVAEALTNVPSEHGSNLKLQIYTFFFHLTSHVQPKISRALV